MLSRLGRRSLMRAPAEPASGGNDELADRLFGALEERMAHTPLGKARVLLLGFPSEDQAELRHLVRLAGARIAAAAASVDVLDDAAGILHYTHLMVDLDAFSDLDAAIEALRDHRVRHPGHIILLFGRSLSGDDLGGERAPIADASLQLPITLPRLTRALFAAATNAAARVRDRPSGGSAQGV